MRKTSPRAVAVLGLLALLALAALAALRSGDGPDASPGPPPNTIVPDQFIARLATEGLGRAPTQDEWSRARSYFTERGCSAETVAGQAREVYGSETYADLDLDPAERVITLYRGVLAREPDAQGFAAATSQLEGGQDWSAVVDTVLSSPELLQGMVPLICAPGSPAYNAPTGTQPLDIAPAGAGFTGDQAALQQTLDRTPSGGTVALAPHAVVRLSTTLRIPPGVTLTTTGDPSPERYARMGRLVRAAPPAEGTDSVLVELGPGAHLRSVWVDGGRAYLGSPVRGAVSVRIQGDGASVENAKLSEPLGGGNVFVSGPNYGVPCKTASVRGNLLTSYTSEHAQGRWADGISVACAKATVEDNAILDATDVGIILYRVPGGSQDSVVQDNVIVNAGRSAYGGLGADPLFGSGQSYSFEDAEIRDNTLWTGARVHMDIGLAVGTRAWFGQAADRGTGAAFTGNTSGDLSIRSTNPIAVAGMLDATVEDNTLTMVPAEPTTCQPAPVAASLADNWASGSIQSPVTNLPLSNCFPEGAH